MIKKVQGKVYLSDISLISMNCIGGTFYHDMNCKFLTPTVNLFFTASDFIKFVNDLDYYLSFTPVVEMGEKYPIGTLDDIKIFFMHYDSCEKKKKKWEDIFLDTPDYVEVKYDTDDSLFIKAEEIRKKEEAKKKPKTIKRERKL